MFVSRSMTRQVITVDPEKTVFEAQELMAQSNIRHLPVIDANQQLIQLLGQMGFKFGEDWKDRGASYGGFKGEGKTGEVKGTEGETYAVHVWTGKKKRQGVAVILIIHEREMRLHKKYYATVLKTLKASK